ncbi:hypothetical protein SSX86_033104, partial [Deinandra increscens subsp. villosa]
MDAVMTCELVRETEIGIGTELGFSGSTGTKTRLLSVRTVTSVAGLNSQANFPQIRSESLKSQSKYDVVADPVCNPNPVIAGDIVHDDKFAPKKPGCENDFVLVKVQTWVDGVEHAEFVGVGARFGTTIVSKEKNANRTPLTQSDPRDCCSPPKKQLTGDVIMVTRGHCKFTTKANIAQAAGASAVLIINNQR